MVIGESLDLMDLSDLQSDNANLAMVKIQTMPCVSCIAQTAIPAVLGMPTHLNDILLILTDGLENPDLQNAC